VKQAIARELPNYRLPLDSDTNPNDLRDMRAVGGPKRCYSVKTGYFRGSSKSIAMFLKRGDIAPAIPKPENMDALAHIYRSGNGWTTEILDRNVWGRNSLSLGYDDGGKKRFNPKQLDSINMSVFDACGGSSYSFNSGRWVESFLDDENHKHE
jgi:hypothetical protein